MATGRFVDLIHTKKNGGELSDDELKSMIKDYSEGNIPDYQMSSMLMAICFNGLNDRELTTMTLAMRDSGEIVDLSKIEGVKVDKHSTGGVGDKTTLIIGPIVAACGVPVAKMSGRGLGFTGGTLDKLESIPGFNVGLSSEEFFSAVKENGISVIGQTGDLAPADKKMYALRDVTGTVDSIPLIAASVMSKKLAAGSDKILLDVTTGSGAFIKDIEGSKELAKRMVAIGKGAGKQTIAMITNMDEPLGYAIGNCMEVWEAIEVLKGGGPDDLKEVCFALAGMMISMGLSTPDNQVTYEEGIAMATSVIENGKAFEKFLAMVKTQGGDIDYINDESRWEKAPYSDELIAKEDGYFYSVMTEGVGVVAGILGAGRETKESDIDPLAGIYMNKKIGDYVKKGEAIATLYTSDSTKLSKALLHMDKCCEIKDKEPEHMKLVLDIIV